MEKFSSFERIVGNISEREKNQILRDKGERFDNQVFDDLIGKEREKTPKELQIISLANKATNEIRKKYQLEDFNIPAQNIHVITEEEWPMEKSFALFSSMLQGIAIRERVSSLGFMKSVFHEMLHFKSYNTAQITNKESPGLDEYRIGLIVKSRDGDKTYFTNLNEAVTEEMTKIYFTQHLNSPIFTNEIKLTKDIINTHSQAITASGESLFNEDTYYAETHSNKSWGESVGRLSGNLSDSTLKILTEGFTYQQERTVLNTLINKLYVRNPNKFKNREEIFEIFAKGMMTGNILPLGRLIEKTFGGNTLRQIGEFNQDTKTLEKFVNHL